MTDLRQAAVDEAKTWLGTPYHHLGDIKGVGVDCAMILVRVYSAIGAIPKDVEPRPYPIDWHLHRDSERYIQQLLPHCKEVTEPKAGDIMLVKFGRTYSHSAIIVDYPTVIHAYLKDRCVTLADATKEFKNREVKFFSLWGE